MFVNIVRFPPVQAGKDAAFREWFAWSNAQYALQPGFVRRRLLVSTNGTIGNTARKVRATPYLLASITNEYGGTVRINYTTSTLIALVCSRCEIANTPGGKPPGVFATGARRLAAIT